MLNSLTLKHTLTIHRGGICNIVSTEDARVPLRKMLRSLDLIIYAYRFCALARSGNTRFHAASCLSLTFLLRPRRMAWTVQLPKYPEALITDLIIVVKLVLDSGSQLETVRSLLIWRHIGRLSTSSLNRRWSSLSPSGIYKSQRSSYESMP